MAGTSDAIKQTGQIDFSGGVNSVCVPTVASDSNPDGLKPNELAWLVNAGVRDGGITQRSGWTKKSPDGGIAPILLASGLGLYQGDTWYEPDTGNPYKIVAVGGHILQVDPDFAQPPIDLTQEFGLVGALSASEPEYFFVQAENYLVIQDGTESNLPLFWDGVTLYKSHGLTGVQVVGSPVALLFQMTVTTGWTQGAAIGDVSSPVYLNAPYTSFGGHLYDNIYIVNLAGTVRGHFRVTSISGNYILLTTIVPGVTANIPAEDVIVTLEIPGNPPVTNNNVIVGVGSWIMPAVGGQVTLPMISPYFGSVGDIITIATTNFSTTYGSFKVVSFDSGGNLRVQLLPGLPAPGVAAGTLITQANLNITVTGFRAFSSTFTTMYAFVIPASGGTMNLIGQRFFPAYTGQVGDFVNIVQPTSGVDFGLFRYTGSILPTGTTGQGSIFEAVLPNPIFVGQTIGAGTGAKVKCTVAAPAVPSQDIVIGVGTWSVPQIGQSVVLQLLWDYTGTGTPTGYPGNVGDTVTLVSNLYPFTIGTFTVTQFSPEGQITLTTVSSPLIGTAAGTFNAPIVGTLTINDAPTKTGLLISQIPAARQMIYYMGRIFYNQGNVVNGADIVGGPSGTSANGYLDSVLSVTENPLVLGGDGFTLPTQSGDITGFSEPNTIDASLGQGLLLISTRKAIYAMQVPLTRNDWIKADSNTQPQIVEVQFDAGFVSDKANVLVNGDVYYFTWKKDVRSLIQATRLFGQPGNVPCSAEEHRILKFTNAALLNFASGIQFDNRLLMTALPMQTPYGVVHQAILPLDFTPISTNRDRQQPVWEGHQEGVQILSLSEQDFDGVDRAFALTLSSDPNFPGAIELWEFLPDSRFENEGRPDEARVTWQVEFPAMEWGDITRLKKLVSAEIWFDRLWGDVEFLVEWRPDSDACWKPWMKWKECSARNSNETPGQPAAYPKPFFEGFRATRTLPKPPEQCESATGRPAHIGYQHQARLTVVGFCRVRGFWLLAEMQDRKLYENMVGALNTLKDFVCNLWKFIIP